MDTHDEFSRTFVLRQHTPMIHFQHWQDGASLRATEVKPLLDKFVIPKIEKNADNKHWFIGIDGNALNYSLIFRMPEKKPNIWFVEEPKTEKGNFVQKNKNNITSTDTFPYPGFFGNMGKNYEVFREIKKMVFFDEDITMTIFGLDSNLVAKICEVIPEFLAGHNFGTRKTKGFGSFYLADTNSYPLSNKWFKYSIDIPLTKKSNNQKEFFKEFYTNLDLFYRSLRSGLNLKKGRDKISILYFKSLLFVYFKSKGVQWEKRKIKEQFFFKSWDRTTKRGIERTSRLSEPIRQYPHSEALSFTSDDTRIVRDLLGLSSEETWMSYNDKITKSNSDIDRFSSPVIFKPIGYHDGMFKVYIIFNQEELSKMLGKNFEIKSKNKTLHLSLRTPESFLLEDFFMFICDSENFSIDKHVERKFHLSDEYNILKSIFNSLTPL